MAINFYCYIVVRTQRNCLHDEVRSYWGGYLIFLVIYLLSPLWRLEKNLPAQSTLLWHNFLAQSSSGFLLQRRSQICLAFLFSCQASAICEYRDWFHLHVCVESHKVLRFVLQTIIWSLPMSNSWYHNFYYGAVHRYNNSMPILFSFLYS